MKKVVMLSILSFSFARNAYAGCAQVESPIFIKNLTRGGFSGLASGSFEFKAEGRGYCFYSYRYSAKTNGGTSSWALVVFNKSKYIGSYEIAPSKVEVRGNHVVVRDIFGRSGRIEFSDMVLGKKSFIIDDEHVFAR